MEYILQNLSTGKFFTFERAMTIGWSSNIEDAYTFETPDEYKTLNAWVLEDLNDLGEVFTIITIITDIRA